MIRRRNHHETANEGFTLIELLVVIGIIVMLTSILMPSLNMAKEMGKSVKCLTNQRAVGMAIHFYASEHGGQLPGSETWIDDILDHLGDDQPSNAFDRNRDNMPEALFCPNDPDPFPRPYMTGTMEVTSYMVNGAETDYAMGGGNEINLGLFGGEMGLNDVNSAGACMMLGESTNYNKVADFDHSAVQDAFSKAGASPANARSRFHHRVTSGFYHRGKMSIYYLDGHSDAIEGEEADSLPPSQWPGGALMDSSTAFYPNLSLPTATDNPRFWGTPYID